MKRYYVYILTNYARQVLYTGITNNLPKRLNEHYHDYVGFENSFAGKYNCVYLIYFEEYTCVRTAIAREKEIKNLTRVKKEELINDFNPKWEFLNQY